MVGGGDDPFDHRGRVQRRDRAGADEGRLAGLGDFAFDFAGFRFDRHFFGRFGDFGFEPGAGADAAGENLRRGRGSGDEGRADRGEQGCQGERCDETSTGDTWGHPGDKRHSLPPP